MSTSPHPTEQTDSKIESLSDESTPGHDEALEKRVWLKLDFYLLPVVAILYLLSFLVRDCRYNVYNVNSPKVTGSHKCRQCANRRLAVGPTYDQSPVQHRTDCHLYSLYCCRATEQSAFEGMLFGAPIINPKRMLSRLGSWSKLHAPDHAIALGYSNDSTRFTQYTIPCPLVG